MKKSMMIWMLAMLSTLMAWADGGNLVMPGIKHFSVEKLNQKIDLNMDISQLSIPELRVLRNAFAARQGYCFMSADLRGLFSTTSW